MKIAITGATGLLGRMLMARFLEQGHRVVAVCRTRSRITELPPEDVFEWDCVHGAFPAAALSGVDAVVHLAGDPVAGGRWSAAKKRAILDSRVLGTRKLVECIASIEGARRPKALINGSAIGIYGDRGDETIDESSPSVSGFLAEVTAAWEREAARAVQLGLRLVQLRTGIVLSRNGGALSKMLPIILGNGRQWMSWIHGEDWARIAGEAVTDDSLSGDFNLTAPKPVTNAEFTEAFRKTVKFPVRARVPSWVLKAALGEMASVVLASQRVLPRRLLQSGFAFAFPDIETALGDLFHDQRLVEERYVARQFAPVEAEAVFGFFSDAGNLEKLTPPWLNFHILRQSTPGVQEGTIIDYTLKIHGVPVKWKTLIADWKPGVSFVDTQLKGPYSKWHHTHTFKKVRGGTLLGDEVIYRVPGGFAGKWILGDWIRGDVNAIFAYRRKIIEDLFGRTPNK